LKKRLIFDQANANAEIARNTIEIAENLGVDPVTHDQNGSRALVGLPNGTGKSLALLYFARGPQG